MKKLIAIIGLTATLTSCGKNTTKSLNNLALQASYLYVTPQQADAMLHIICIENDYLFEAIDAKIEAGDDPKSVIQLNETGKSIQDNYGTCAAFKDQYDHDKFIKKFNEYRAQ